MNKILFKQFQLDLKSIDIKALEKGELQIAFATKGVWDKDGDFTEDGFFGEQDVFMIPAHDWTHVPIGKGRTYEEKNMAVARIKMNLAIPAAKDWHSSILFDLKEGNNPIQEYSYGFKILEGAQEMGDRLGRRGRILRPLADGTPGSKIWEISPVLVGAGERTRTLAAKGAKFCDEIETALESVKGVVDRAKALAAIRAKEGRELGEESLVKMVKLLESLELASKDLKGLTEGTKASPGAIAANKELARMLKLRAGINK